MKKETDENNSFDAQNRENSSKLVNTDSAINLSEKALRVPTAPEA